nr:universal stress protein [Myxococcota bacterium]
MSDRDRPILCATDFSNSGERALDLAIAAGRALGRSLVLAHVMDTGRAADEHAPRATAEADRVLHERVQARVSEAQRALEREARRATGTAIETALLDGRPWEAIVAHASAIDASCIVIGAHGTSDPVRLVRDEALGWLLGSTADRVVRASPCPVLVGTRDGEIVSLEGARWIVGVALDGASKHALEAALQLAERARAHLE